MSRLSTSFYFAGVLLALVTPLKANADGTADRYGFNTLTELPCAEAGVLLNEGIDAGNAEALFSAGRMYSEGACVATDATKALHYWKLAAERGHRDATASLALVVGLGQGVPQDYAAAGALLRQAGVRLGADANQSDYTLGYAYTWLRAMQDDVQYPQSLRASNVVGLAEVEWQPKAGTWKLVSFRRTGGNREPQLGSNVDRSRSRVSEALADAAKSASARVAPADAAKLDGLSYVVRMPIGPSADDTVSASNPAIQIQRSLSGSANPAARRSGGP